MEKTRSRENIASSEGENKSTSSSKTQPEVDFSDLIHELAEINQKGNSLFKESKLDLAQNELIKGDEIFQKEAQKLYNLYIDHPNFEKILALFKTNLSLIAKTFFEQKDYNNAISYDLKVICLEPKDEESIIRLFKSYSKIEKSQQAVYYGDLFMGMDISSQNKFQNVIKDIENEKIKLNSLQNLWINRIKLVLFNLILFVTIILIAMFFLRTRRNI